MQSFDFQRIVRQTVLLTWASLKARYRKTFAGFIWVLLNPLIMFGVQSFVFKTFLKLDVANFYVFLLTGLLPWIFLVQTIQMSATILVMRNSLLKAFRFSPIVLVTSVALDNFINFVITFLLIATPAIFLSGVSLQGLLLLPLCMIPVLIGTMALSLLFSLMNVFLRDTSFVLSFAFSIFFFLTPIFYPIEYIPLHLRWVVQWNPFYHLIHPFRAAILDFEIMNFIDVWLKAMMWAAAMVIMSVLYWRKKRNGIYIHL